MSEFNQPALLPISQALFVSNFAVPSTYTPADLSTLKKRTGRAKVSQKGQAVADVAIKVHDSWFGGWHGLERC